MGDDTGRLVDRASNGDVPALEELVTRHLPGLRAYLRVHSGPVIRAKESASDLAQSVFREVFQDLDDFEYRGEEPFRQWLYLTAERKLIDRHRFYRREKRDAEREVDVAAQAGSTILAPESLVEAYRRVVTPSQHAVAREEVQRIEAAFDRLNPEHREVIISARLLGLSHREISERMDRSEEATRNLLRRALAKLALELRAGRRSEAAGG